MLFNQKKIIKVFIFKISFLSDNKRLLKMLSFVVKIRELKLLTKKKLIILLITEITSVN